MIHQDAGTHLLSIRPEKKSYVPVPIGPAIPRRTVNHLKAQYS